MKNTRVFAWAAAACGVLVLTAVGTIWLGWEPYVSSIATVGTALGTLGLALWTIRLALVTGSSVETAQAALKVAEDGHRLALEQQSTMRDELNQLSIQALAAQDSARAALASSAEATRTRIDAISPMVTLALEEAHVYMRTDPTLWQSFDGADWVKVSEIREGNFKVELTFTLVNHGKSAAVLFFGGTAGSFQEIRQRGGGYLSLGPGEKHTDFLEIVPTRDEILSHKDVHVVVTSNGLIFNEVVDRIQWDAVVRVGRVEGERLDALRNGEAVNTNGGYVFRDYPILENPDEVVARRSRVIDAANGA